MKFFGRKTKASYLMTVTLLVQKVAYIYAVLLERDGFCIFYQFWEIWAWNEKKFFENFFTSFLPKNTKYERKLWRHF